MTSKDDTIAELRRLVEKQSKQIEAQGLRIEALTNEVEQLKLQLAKAAKDSSNSSKPPSSDFMNSTKQKKKPGRPRKKRVGGQPGHKRQQREPLPPDRVDETIEYEINDKEIDRLELMSTDQFETSQHIELPDTPIYVTEHRLRL
jgi:transposase